ncbi:MAG: GNAT family N-acetyltransferase [Hyphomicrobium aestuarii]|nr:GNAT family N-acetyltransferase [Hyphomicrobium aestuarii]
MTVTFKVLEHTNHTEIDRLIEIYQEAIDPSEQKSPPEIIGMLQDHRYVLMIGSDECGTLGFSISFYPQNADFWLLEYMAVDSKQRSRGVGEALFNAAYNHGLSFDPNRIMVLEVDQPGQSNNPKNDTVSRFRFYSRMKCRRITGLDYILPLEAAGPPPPMMLLVFRQPPIDRLPKSKVREWLIRMYVDVYGQSANDPRIDISMSQLGDSVVCDSLS